MGLGAWGLGFRVLGFGGLGFGASGIQYNWGHKHMLSQVLGPLYWGLVVAASSTYGLGLPSQTEFIGPEQRNKSTALASRISKST